MIEEYVPELERHNGIGDIKKFQTYILSTSMVQSFVADSKSNDCIKATLWAKLGRRYAAHAYLFEGVSSICHWSLATQAAANASTLMIWNLKFGVNELAIMPGVYLEDYS